MAELIAPRAHNRLYRMLTLGGYVAFNLPRTVTAAGTALLAVLAATHLYVVVCGPAVSAPFALYCAAAIVGFLAAAAIMWLDLSPRAPQAGWLFGSVLCAAFVTAYLVTRVMRLPDLESVTGRWDLAPGTLALACAAAFIALHGSVLLGINVAFGQRRNWHD